MCAVLEVRKWKQSTSFQHRMHRELLISYIHAENASSGETRNNFKATKMWEPLQTCCMLKLFEQPIRSLGKESSNQKRDSRLPASSKVDRIFNQWPAGIHGCGHLWSLVRLLPSFLNAYLLCCVTSKQLQSLLEVFVLSSSSSAPLHLSLVPHFLLFLCELAHSCGD